MKTKLTLLFLGILSAGFCAEPGISINENFDVIQNGANLGKAGDVVVNHKENPALVVAVNVAIMNHLAKIRADASAAISRSKGDAEAQLQAVRKERDVAISAAKKERDAAISEAKTAEHSRQQSEARLSALVSALRRIKFPDSVKSEVNRALASEREREKTELEAQKAAIEAKISALPK